MGQLRRMAKVGIPLLLALTLAACGSGKPASKSSTSTSSKSKKSATTPKSTHNTIAVTTTTLASSTASTLTSAVTSYETAQGVKQSEYTIGHLETSSADSTWALFSIVPAAGETNLQGGYGFMHVTSGNWSVVGFGSAEVGCPPGAKGNKAVPAKVLASFHLACPSPTRTSAPPLPPVVT